MPDTPPSSPVDDALARQRSFRSCLGQFATGVAVMTAVADDRHVGMTANSFSSLSLEPPLVLWSIARSSRSCDVFAQADAFAINVLASDQLALSQHFARSALDKFATVAWQPGIHGAALLQGAVAHFECKRHAVIDGGDHLILIGRVENFIQQPGSPLLFAQGRYAVAEEHPHLKPLPVQAAPAVETGGDSPDLLTRLFLANHLASRAFEQQRQAEGLTFAESRIVYALYDKPGMTLSALERQTDIPCSVAQDAVAELLQKTLVRKVSDGTIELTSLGRRRRDSILERSATFSADSLAWASAQTVDLVSHFLGEYSQRLAAQRSPDRD